MDPIVIVGSGPSGVHFALSLLLKGRRVTMIDVGYQKPAPVNLLDSLHALKEDLEDPVGYFLGENYDGVLLPGTEKEYYAIPPNKNYVFQSPGDFDYRASGFNPLFSFARGGLAEVWTGGSYPFNDDELADFPFDYREIGPCYSEVARRIGVTGTRDDLARFFPHHECLLPALELDLHSAELLRAYEKHRSSLNERHAFYLGRTRVATLSEDRGRRKKCSYLGRCLWGCPSDSLYVPSITLSECLEHGGFTYRPNLRVTHFRFNSGNRITHVVAQPAEGGEPCEFPAGTLILAAGALCSSQIFLESIYRDTGDAPQLRGLMDNRQILIPFVNLRLVGRPYNPESYQYHQLGIGLETGNPREYVHGLITTLKTAMLHPILQNLPCDLKTAIFLLRTMHCALGIINVNFHDTPRSGNYVALEVDKRTGNTRLVIHYAPAATQVAFIRRSLSTIRKSLWRLGCIIPPGMAHVRPMGASAHYAGTLPMSQEKRPYATSEYCQSHDFENLFVADGATFPFLPAKNITFTLMANAVRVAEAAF